MASQRDQVQEALLLGHSGNTTPLILRTGWWTSELEARWRDRE
ncbi:hypothetical protein [Sinorhizobium medicae]|nr:hypothetical protein [Sinorhizobium medicae]